MNKMVFAIGWIAKINEFFRRCSDMDISNIRMADRRDGMSEFNFVTTEDGDKIVNIMRSSNMISICWCPLER